MSLEQEIGAKIKYYRKKNGLKISDLAERINKSSATVSKYENGQIVIDIATFYEVAEALGVRPEILLYSEPASEKSLAQDSLPAFFRDVNRLYMYYFDGRNQKIVRSVLDIRGKIETGVYDVILYMNFEDYEHCQNSEITYVGTLSHFGAVSNIPVQNCHSEMDVYFICVLSPYLNGDTKWCQAFGISGRPIMPTSNKVYLSKTIQKETSDFIQSLHVSREDIRLLKQYNMLTVL